MRSHSNRSVVALLAVLAFGLLSGCGDKDTASGSSDPAKTATGGSATDGSKGDDKATVDVPKSGVSFDEVLDDDSLSTEARSELQITLSVIGMDRAGYVSGSTIVAQTSEDDMEDRQFTCIAAGQRNNKDNQYTVVVVDETGKNLDC